MRRQAAGRALGSPLRLGDPGGLAFSGCVCVCGHTPSKTLWVLFLGGHTAASILLLLNALGLLVPPGPGPILASLVWVLFVGAMQLIRIVVARPPA